MSEKRGYWQVEGDLSEEEATLAVASVIEAEAQGKSLIVVDGVTLRWVGPATDSLDAARAEIATLRAALDAHHGSRYYEKAACNICASLALAAKLREAGYVCSGPHPEPNRSDAKLREVGLAEDLMDDADRDRKLVEEWSGTLPDVEP